MASADKVEALKYAISKGAKLDLRSDRGETAVHYAANHGYAAILQVLVDAGAKIGIYFRYLFKRLLRFDCSNISEIIMEKLLMTLRA